MSMSKQNDKMIGQASMSCLGLEGTAGRKQHHADDAVEPSRAPWALWRTWRAEQFDVADADTLQHLLAKTSLFGQPKWRNAVGGDVSAAVGVAVSFLPVDEVTVQFDIAMTALISYAIEGDAAAAIVVSNILRSLPGRERLHRRIATSWFVSNLAALSAGASKPQPAHKGGVRKAFRHRRKVSARSVGAPPRNRLTPVSQLFGDREGTS